MGHCSKCFLVDESYIILPKVFSQNRVNSKYHDVSLYIIAQPTWSKATAVGKRKPFVEEIQRQDVLEAVSEAKQGQLENRCFAGRVRHGSRQEQKS